MQKKHYWGLNLLASLFLVMSVLLAIGGCKFTEVSDGQLVSRGTDIVSVPDVVPDIPNEDIVGAVVDAARDVPVSNIVRDSSSGNYWGLGATILGFVGAVLAGIGLRRRIRKRGKNV